jgi:hypothetical protein
MAAPERFKRVDVDDSLESGSVDTDDIPVSSFETWFSKDLFQSEAWLWQTQIIASKDSYWGKGTTQDGSLNFFGSRVQLDTGSGDGNAGDSASIRLNPTENNPYKHGTYNVTSREWDDRYLMRFGAEITDSQADRVDYWTIGNVVDDQEGAGFKLENGDLKGVVHDGTSETTTNAIVSGVGTTNRYCLTDFRGSDGAVDFYVDGFDSPDATLSSGLPTGSTPGTIIRFSIENTSDVQRRSRFNELWFATIPNS